MKRSRRVYPLLILSLLVAPSLARAQVDDPGLDLKSPPPPPSSPTPAPSPTPPPSPIIPPPPPRLGRPTSPGPLPPPVSPAAETPVREDVKEEVSTLPGAGLSDDEWERQLAVPSLLGPIGLLRTHTAEVGGPLHFRVALHMQAFEETSFLISGAGVGDDDSRFLGDLTIGLTGPDVPLLRNLEIYLSILNSSNQNVRKDPGRTDPTVILALGDTAVGVKGAWSAGSALSLGGHVGLRFYNSISSVSASLDAATFDLIGSFDVRKLAPSVPLRFHLNAGYLYDDSLSLLPAMQCAKSTGVDPCIRSRVVETFGYGLGVSRLRFALAAEIPLRPHVSWGIFGIDLFGEYHLEDVVGDGDATVAGALKNSRVGDDRINNALIQYLTLGLRLRPVARLVIDLGLDLGLQSPGFRYGPPLPTWNVILGATYTFDPHASSTRLVTRTITRTVETSGGGGGGGKVRGVVRDARTRKPLGGVALRYPNQGGRSLSAQMTDEDGAFTSYGFPPGPVRIDASRDDYEPASATVEVQAGTESTVELKLEPKPAREGRVRLRVVDDKGQAILGGTARFAGPVTREAIADAGGFTASLPAGDYTLTFDAPNYLARDKTVTVVTGQETQVDLAVRRRPAQSRVTVTRDAIVLKGTIHFGTNNATILPDGQQLLDEVVDVLAKSSQIRRVAVEGHTDNRGGAEKNLKLSKDRARAVVEYLVKQGIAPDRLVSEGFGATKPLVPNLTAANRAKNRRVEFRIVDQGAGLPQ